MSMMKEFREFAMRGSIVDIYPSGLEAGLRLDFFGDEVESLRTFDPESQRTLEQLTNIHLLPAKEYPLDREGRAGHLPVRRG